MSTKGKFTEEELFQLLKQKNKSALDYLYDKYSGALYGIILKIMNGDEGAAQVIFQEVFVNIWNSIHKYDRNKTTLFIWMLKIARQVAFDKIRMTSGEASYSNKSNVYSANDEGQNTVLDMVNVQSKVKPERRAIFDMVFIGYSQKEISEKYNIPFEKVCMETRAALIEIRNKFS
jgi:RNA polymerase sigma factor (sigma-70 family)